MHVFISIVGILLTIFFVVGTHEAAHFAMARWVGVKVLRFSIGFGKKLISWRDKRGTEYVLALIPLGGYVKMLGEEPENHAQEDLKHAYHTQPFYKKFLIVLAGPAINLICAVFLYWAIFVTGFVTIKPVIGTVMPHSIAANAGMQPNEQIIMLDNKPMSSWSGIVFRLLAHIGDQERTTLQTISLRNNTTHTYQLDLSQWKMNELQPDPFSSLGILPYEPPIIMVKWPKDMLQTIHYGPLEAIPHALQSTWDLAYFNLVLFGKLFTGKLSLQSLGGPITIFQSAGEALNSGFLSFMGFLAFLSVSIGIINLFPIPGLDGGHLAMQLIETLMRKPIPERYQLFAFRLGFALILFMLFQAVANDVLRLA